MRAVSLHPDVIVVTSALLQVNCVIVRGAFAAEVEDDGPERAGSVEGVGGDAAGGDAAGETFVIDSPVLPDELDALPSLLEQAQFPAPSGLLATHGDWDHLLGRLAFPDAALGCAESTVERLRASPGEAQRELRAFDEELMIERSRPLALGSVQGLAVPGRCEIGSHELELHPAGGHTVDGMAVWISWARVLVVGDYLSSVEIPALSDGGDPDAYLATLGHLRGFLTHAEHVVPGHGPILAGDRALATLEEDVAYVRALQTSGADAELPSGRRAAANRGVHLRKITVARDRCS